jgi:hypothetical protein
MFLKRRKNSTKAKTGIVLLAIKEIRFHDKVEYRIPSLMCLPLTQAGMGT